MTMDETSELFKFVVPSETTKVAMTATFMVESFAVGPFELTFPAKLMHHIMLRDLLTQKCVNKKRLLLILDTPEHVDSENIK
jgi:hypothetical protein